MKISLPLKIIIVLLLFSVVLFATLSFFSSNNLRSVFTQSFLERAKATTRSLEAGIASKEEFRDKNKLLLIIQKNIWLDADIENISFSIPQDGEIVTYVSSDQRNLNKKSSFENRDSFNNDIFISKIIKSGASEKLEAISPIHISGEIVGTIQIDLSLDDVNKKIEEAIYSSLSIYITIIILFLLLIYVFIRMTILAPLLKINKGLKAVSENDYNYNVEVKSKDEFGDLAKAFGQMVGVVKESRAQIEEKVIEQTKEISKKAEELQKQKSAILNLLEDINKEKDSIERKVLERTSELKEEQARLLASINSLSFGFIIADVNHQILLRNKAILDLFGLNEGSEMSIDDISKLLGDHVDVKAEVTKCVIDKKTCEIKEIFFGPKVLRGVIAPILREDGGENIGYVFLLEDITEARAIDKAKTEFVSLASHQLRTPLSAINWYTEMLLSGDAGELNTEQKEFLEDVITSSKRMSTLVGTLLNVSRIELGTFSINPENQDLCQIIEDEIKDLRVQIDEKKIEIELLFDLKPAFVFVDSKLLSIVIQNFLTNAIKYNSSGGKISLGVKKDENTGEVIFSVIDTGYGIPLESQGKIFTKMYRADNAVSLDADGNGLGLYMVKSILETSGCEVFFESPPKNQKQGTAFYVHIPKEGMKQVKAQKRLGDAIS